MKQNVMNENQLMNFEKEFEGRNVGFRINKVTGVSEVRIDDVAKFCGWSYKRADRGGKEFIRWNTVNDFLHDLGVSQEVATDDFIPECIMYPLIGKAKNEKATKFMLWVGHVLVEIREHGGYIIENATEEQVDKLTKYSLPKLKNTFITENIESIHDIYYDVKEFYKNKNTNFRLKMMKNIKCGLEERINIYKDKKQIALITLCDDLIKIILSDIDQLRQRISGGQKSHKTKLINKLQPKDDEYMILNCHGMSENYMYETIYDKELNENITRKTKSYNNWIKNFPEYQLKNKDELNIDWTRKINVFLKFDCLETFDTQNMIKSTIDQIITRCYYEDDRIVEKIVTEKNKSVKSYKDGKIYICIKNI